MTGGDRAAAGREVSVSRRRPDTPAALPACAGRATVTPEALVPAGVMAAWSRNGQQIYFLSFRPGTGGNPEIFVMNADGMDATRLTFAPGEHGILTVR